MASIINATTTNGVAVQGDNSGSLQLQTNSGTTAVTINTSQNVGIGTSSPSCRLDLNRGSAGLLANFTDGVNTNFQIETASLLATIGPSAGSTGMAFKTGNTERMRITSGGTVVVGTTAQVGSEILGALQTADNQCFAIQANNASYTNDAQIIYANRNTTNNSFYYFACYNIGATAYKFRIADSGNATNTNGSYGTISDAKLKENIVDATPKLDKVNQLKVRNYNFIGDDLKQIGFVAQEFEKVFPSMVEESQDKTPDGEMLGTTTKTIKTTVLIPILVKAIQELKAELDATKAEVQALKGVK